MGLGVCFGCRRHVRGESCPFCGERVAAPIPRPRVGRTSRRGLALAATAIAVACGGTTDGKDGSADAMDDNISVAAYGIAVDASFDAGKDAGDAGKDAPASAYGLPPMDGGGG